jgi:hypothetical protein
MKSFRKYLKKIAQRNILKAYFPRLCVTREIDIHIVNSRGTGIDSMCPDLTADFGESTISTEILLSSCVYEGI